MGAAFFAYQCADAAVRHVNPYKVKGVQSAVHADEIDISVRMGILVKRRKKQFLILESPDIDRRHRTFVGIGKIYAVSYRSGVPRHGEFVRLGFRSRLGQAVDNGQGADGFLIFFDEDIFMAFPDPVPYCPAPAFSFGRIRGIAPCRIGGPLCPVMAETDAV